VKATVPALAVAQGNYRVDRLIHKGGSKNRIEVPSMPKKKKRPLFGFHTERIFQTMAKSRGPEEPATLNSKFPTLASHGAARWQEWKESPW